MVMRPRQEDVDLLQHLIDLRDSAHLAGHTTLPFMLIHDGPHEDLVSAPGDNRANGVPGLLVKRLQDEGVIEIVKNLPHGFTFDLSDDCRERLDQMRASLGQPSRMGELEADVASARWDQNVARVAREHLERQVSRASADSAARREAAATKIGSRVRRVASVALVVVYALVYVAVVAVGYFWTSNPVVGVGIVAIGTLLALLAGVFRIDGFWLAGKAGDYCSGFIRRWLDAIEGSTGD